MKKSAIALGLLGLTLLTGCGSKNDAGSGNGKTTIRFQWWGGDSRHRATLDAIKLFEEKNPGIKVKAEYAGWGGYNDKLTTQVVGNSAPDVMQVNWNMLYALRGGNFYDLNNLDIDLSNYPAEIIEGVTIDGRVVAVPYGITGKVFYYNETTYEKAGLSVPTSFADMIAAAPVFKEKLGNDYYPFDTDQYGAFLIALYQLEQKTGKAFIENNEVAYTEDDITEALEYYSMLVDKGVIPSLPTRAAAGNIPLDQHPDWIAGKFAGTYEWDSAAAKWEGSLAEGQELVVGEMPYDMGTTPSAFNKISMTFAVDNKTKHPDESAKLIEFLVSDPEAVEILGMSRGLPANAKAQEVLKGAGELGGLNYLGNVKVMENLGKGIHYHFEHGQLQQIYRDTIEELGNGVINERQAAKKIIEGVNSFLASNK